VLNIILCYLYVVYDLGRIENFSISFDQTRSNQRVENIERGNLVPFFASCHAEPVPVSGDLNSSTKHLKKMESAYIRAYISEVWCPAITK
jgi:hypothetical protein